jgi:hypothetical protein
MDLENEIRILRKTFAEKSTDCVNLLKEVSLQMLASVISAYISYLRIKVGTILCQLYCVMHWKLFSTNNMNGCKDTILFRSMMHTYHFFYSTWAMVLLLFLCVYQAQTSSIFNIWNIFSG